MQSTKLILIGGFLGAGKTSLMARTAEILKGQGKTVGLITNDQASDLVDTAFLSDQENEVREVSGSCFCCNYPGFADAIDDLTEKTHCDITLAEPVGSCTDLSATIMQPTKDKYAQVIDLAPLTVLADPERLRAILDGVYSTASYIITRQFDEADIILVNKIDLLNDDEAAELRARAQERWPHAQVLTASVKDGTGIEEWLAAVQAASKAGQNLAVVDYDEYAAGEAAYGWLNLTYSLGKAEAGYAGAAQSLLDALAAGFQEKGVGVGHVKFLLQGAEHAWMGNFTGGAEPSMLRVEEQESEEYSLTVNARAEMMPLSLEKLVVHTVDAAVDGFEVTDIRVRVLIPGRPNPTYRYDEVI